MANLVDVHALSKYFRRDIRTVQLWSKEENWPKEKRGEYDFIICTRLHLDRLEKELAEAKGNVRTSKERKENAQAAREELKLAIELKEFIPAKIHLSIIEKIISAINTKIPNWPRKMAIEIFNSKTKKVKDIEEIINEHSNKLLTELSTIGNTAASVVGNNGNNKEDVSGTKAAHPGTIKRLGKQELLFK